MPLKSVDVETLKKWVDSGEAIIVDVREPAEYRAESIPGSVLLPLSKVSKNQLPESKGRKIVLHCKAGKRGGSACEKLIAEDSSLELYNLDGGIEAWEKAGYKIKKLGKSFLPLDRQVQLSIGLFVLLGIVLGALIDPLFLIIPAIFGAGLINAGLTGWCGLALLMAKMPWNK